MLRYVMVFLLSTGAAFSAISVSPTSFAVTYKQGSALPGPLTVTVQSSGSLFAAAVGADQTAWLDVNPKQGVGASVVNITLDPRNLSPGSYTGLVTFSETTPAPVSASVRIDLTVTSATVTPTPITPITLGYIAHVADGNSWKTALTVVNLQDVQQQITVKFYSDSGRELPLPIEGVGTYSGVNFVLPANGSGSLETTGAGTTIATGWISVQGSANGFGAMAVFRSTGSGRADTEATSPMRLNPARKSVIPFDNRGGFATGLAMANFDSKPNTPALLFRDGDGKTILATTLAMGTGEHAAFSLADKYPVLAGAVGTIEITSDGVTALGLRFNPTGSFTSIQVIEKAP